jgi:hypothetical protein
MQRSLCVLCVCLFISGAISADDLDFVAFAGTVTDANRAAVPDIVVIAKNVTTGIERTAKTKADGSYRLTALPPGVYELRAERKDFQTVRLTDINVVAGTTLIRNFALQPAQLAEQVIIESATSAIEIDTTRTVIGGTLNRENIDKLPVESRNVLDLVYLLPGTAAPAFSDRELADGDARDNFRRTPEESGIFGLQGGSAFSNNLTIEGLDNNDDRAARERFVPTLDAVEEVQVVTNQFSSEYGRASGGRVNLRLRGGSNQWRGRAFYFFRDEALNANSFRRNAQPERGFRLPYQNHNPGATLGGPLKQKKWFVFGAYEYDDIYDRADIAALVPINQNPLLPLPRANGANLGFTGRNAQNQPVIFNNGEAVGLYDERITTPRRAHTAQVRSDVNFSDTHNAFVIFSLAAQRDERGFAGGRATLDTIRRTGRDSFGIAFADNFVLSARGVINTRFQISRLTPADAPPSDSPVVLIDIDDPRDVPGNTSANPFSRSGNLLAGSSNISGTDRRETRWQFQQTMNGQFGAHSLRIGLDLQAIRSRFVDLGDITGTFRFASVKDFLTNNITRFEQRFNTEADLRNSYTGVFVQDDWRIRPGLTLAFGLRWDNETIITDRNNLGPRISLAYAPKNSSKTVVRAGYGIFYNRAMLRTLDDYTLTSNTLAIDTNTATALLSQLRFPQPLAPNDPRVTQFGIREAGFLRRLSKDFRIPESYQASFGFERELRKGTKLEANYIFNRGLHLWREINANAARLPAGFATFTAYLTSRDFDNRAVNGVRPLTATGNADTVRFDLGTINNRTITENGRPVVIFGLNTTSTSNAVGPLVTALRAIRTLRPNPDLTQVEELQAVGNSYYHGVSFELTQRLSKRGTLRGSYTLSKLIDDGTLNTSSPLIVSDWRNERALSSLDARHRVALSGYYQLLLKVNLSGTLVLSSARPFNISVGASGNDRNLDDVNTDRPNFNGKLGTPGAIDWRRNDAALSATLANAFSLPVIGSVGNLPRNAGRGPATHSLNLRLSRAFKFAESRTADFQIEAFNPLNATVYSFGSEFVNYVPTSLGNFLVPPRTIRPRTMRLGVRFSF